jgi:hypothetical protein
MTLILDGEHISIDDAACARCGKPRTLLDCVADNSAIAAVGVTCKACDAVTVLRYVIDPFTTTAS